MNLLLAFIILYTFTHLAVDLLLFTFFRSRCIILTLLSTDSRKPLANQPSHTVFLMFSGAPRREMWSLSRSSSPSLPFMFPISQCLSLHSASECSFRTVESDSHLCFVFSCCLNKFPGTWQPSLVHHLRVPRATTSGLMWVETLPRLSPP